MMTEPGLSAVDVRRLANDAIHDAASTVAESPASTFQFLCECGDLRCDSLVTLSLGQYASSRPGTVREH
jgi:hypothetical protein